MIAHIAKYCFRYLNFFLMISSMSANSFDRNDAFRLFSDELGSHTPLIHDPLDRWCCLWFRTSTALESFDKR